MAFLQSFVSQQLLFLFSKHLDTMSIRRIVFPVKQIFDQKYNLHIDLQILYAPKN